MSAFVHLGYPHLSAAKSTSAPHFPKPARLSGASSVRCASTTTDDRHVMLKNGNDSLKICHVINGLWQPSGEPGAIDSDKAVEAMLGYADAGLTTFDMSNHYGPTEDLYGIFINRIRRERQPEFLDQIKGLMKWVPKPKMCTSSFYVRECIHKSLKRIGLSSLDMLQFHWWDYSDSCYLDTLKHLTDLRQQGIIKSLALTNFDTKRLQIILENGIPIVSNQVSHSVIDMRPQQKMAELCRSTGVKLITYGTLMGGLLSEKFLDTNLNPPSASLQNYRKILDAWGDWNEFQVLLNTLKKIATKHGVSIPAVAIKYILNQPEVAGSVIKVRFGSSEHIEDANAIFSIALDEEDIDSIEEVSKKGKDLMKKIGDCGDEYRLSI